jgi:hypothetical protein
MTAEEWVRHALGHGHCAKLIGNLPILRDILYDCGHLHGLDIAALRVATRSNEYLSQIVLSAGILVCSIVRVRLAIVAPR